MILASSHPSQFKECNWRAVVTSLWSVKRVALLSGHPYLWCKTLQSFSSRNCRIAQADCALIFSMFLSNCLSQSGKMKSLGQGRLLSPSCDSLRSARESVSTSCCMLPSRQAREHVILLCLSCHLFWITPLYSIRIFQFSHFFSSLLQKYMGCRTKIHLTMIVSITQSPFSSKQLEITLLI